MASTHVARISAGGVTNRTIAPSIYLTCSTAQGTAAKVITNTGATWTASDFFQGLTIFVKFTAANTVASPTLNIDSTGAKPIYRYGTTAPSTSAATSWNAGAVVGLTYDTTLNTSGCWVMHAWNNTTYSNMTQAQADTPATTTGYLISPKVLNDTIDAKVTAATGFQTVSIGSASAGTAIAADDITGWTTNTPTVVTKKTVVTGGTTTAIPNISKKTVVTGVTKKTVVTGGSTTNITPVTKKTVVTAASGGTSAVTDGVLTITDASFTTGDSVTTGTAVAAYTSLTTGDSVTVTTGDSVTVGTAINAYTSLTTGDSVDVTAGTAASLSYTARSIPNISVTATDVLAPAAQS